ncbi:MAG TPA: hypothetical protein VNH18_21595 [Bryobacteraceae bacterium]|nr:hypothetical protein [Bryobacteraceae bacterium]
MLEPLPHTYEEIRDVTVDIVLKRVSVHYEPSQFQNLVTGVGEVFERRRNPDARNFHPDMARLHPFDAELVRDVFWDLFRQGFITIGMDRHNDQWPWFRLSHFGEKALDTQSPYRFHDAGSFISALRGEVPDISSEAIVYLQEAVAAFYAGCLLACCVMLGVAAEAEFLRLAETASENPAHGQKFAAVAKHQALRRKITVFQDCLRSIMPSLPQEATEDFDANFLAVQSVLRIARNEAGHPTGATPQRENVYVSLQLFIPFARQLMRLRRALA